MMIVTGYSNSETIVSILKKGKNERSARELRTRAILLRLDSREDLWQIEWDCSRVVSKNDSVGCETSRSS